MVYILAPANKRRRLDLDPDDLSGEGGQGAQNPGVDSVGALRGILLSHMTPPNS